MESSEIRIEIDDVDGVAIDMSRRKKNTKRSSVDQPALLFAPVHVHNNEWKDMLSLSDVLAQPKGAYDNRAFEDIPRPRSNTKQVSWIEQNIKKRECNHFIPSQKYLNKCGCGRHFDHHSSEAKTHSNLEKGVDTPREEGNSVPGTTSISRQRWAIKKHTVLLPTDAYGTINFEGGGHQTVARYARVSFDTSPDTLLKLLHGVWRMKPPKLIITIHGGLTNFDLQPKLGRALRRGLMKAAQSTDVWIITTGMHQGVVRHICDALSDLKGNRRTKAQVNSIGIAPWGLIKKRNGLIGENQTVKYNMNLFARGKFTMLNDAHSHFLMVDNGTVGRYGAEIILRRQLETLLATGTAPVVALLVEGGGFSVKLVHDYLTTSPSIPVVVCDGSGRASDLLSFTHQYLKEEDYLPDSIRAQLLNLVKQVFGMDDIQSTRLLRQIIESARMKKLMNIFRLGEGMDDVDHAIFSALIKGSKVDQLRLALAWNRVDIARNQIFGGTFEWTQADMHEALMFALLHDRVEFVHLILEKGVAMQNFLTFDRLEKLYNTDFGPNHTLHSVTETEEFTLPQIGGVVERLIGRGFRSTYTSDEFLNRYNIYINANAAVSTKKSVSTPISHMNETNGASLRKRTVKHSNDHFDEDEEDNSVEDVKNIFAFERPFHELLIWAVLTKRQKMAMMMWRHGDEGMAKALIASRLYSSLANNAADDYLDLSLCEELRGNAEEFRKLACELLDFCYKIDEEYTSSLLTYELTNWGSLTCMNLAVILHDRQFMKHPCPQSILTEMWLGGLSVRSNMDIIILTGLICPPIIFLLDFKSKEELRDQPHTAAEHYDGDDSSSESSLSSDSSYSESDTDSEDEKQTTKISSSSNLSLSSFMANAHRSFRKKDEPKQPQTINQLAAHTLPGLFQGAGVPSPTTTGAISIGNGVVPSVERTRTSTIQKTQKKRNDGAAGKIARRVSRGSTMGASRKDTTEMSDIWELENEKQKTKKTNISWTQKIFEFYTAPITTFWLWSLGFAVFQIMLVYVLLIRTEPNIRWEEFYLIAYVVVLGCDLTRKFIYYDVQPFTHKLYKFFWAFRNGTSLIAVVTYIIGFILRCIPETMITGRVLLIMNSFLWSFKLIDYLTVHRSLGPLISIAGNMLMSAFPMYVMIFVSLLSYGVIKQSITYPDEDWDWLLVRNIFLHPYYMLYGEVYADQIDTCNDGIWDYHIDQGIPIAEMNGTDPTGTCVPGHWVSPLYMTFFMLIGTVLLLNMIVASCTWVYEHQVEYVKEIYLLERFRHVMEYDSMPFLPPPLSIIGHVYLLIKYFMSSGSRKRFMDNSLKSFLSPDRLIALHRFESECLEDMERKRAWDKQHSQVEHVSKTAKTSDQILNKLGTMATVEDLLRESIREMDQRMSRIEGASKERLDLLKWNTSILAQMSGSTAPHTSSTLSVTEKKPPRILVRQSTEDYSRYGSVDLTDHEDDEDEDRNRQSKTGLQHRHHTEYTTIADCIRGPTPRSAPTAVLPRRNRYPSTDVNSMLFSVSEGDEHQVSDFAHSDVE